MKVLDAKSLDSVSKKFDLSLGITKRYICSNCGLKEEKITDKCPTS